MAIAPLYDAMHGSHSLATAIAIADYLETYTSEVPLDNIVRLAEALEQSGNSSRLPLVSPRELGNLIDALPVEILKQLKTNGTKRASS